MDKQVAAYINKLPSPQKEIIIKVREIFLKTVPGCKEKMTWGVIVYGDHKFYLASMKKRVHVGFAIMDLSKEEISVFEGSGKTMRHIKIHTIDDIDEKTLVHLITIVDTKATCIQQ